MRARKAVARRFFILEIGAMMKSIRAYTAACIVSLALAIMSFAPALAADIPSDDDQDIMIRSTLMTFNDANMANNYAVLFAKASKQFQDQITQEKMQSAFEPFRKN